MNVIFILYIQAEKINLFEKISFPILEIKEIK